MIHPFRLVNVLKNNNLDGVYFLIGSQLFLASMDALGKALSASYPPLVLVLARYLVLFIIILALGGRKVLRLAISSQHIVSHISRASLLLTTSILGLYALKLLPLAETAGLAFTSPLFAILLSKILLGEEVGLLRWFCMFGGFFGAFLIALPGGVVSLQGVLLAILASVSFAFYQIITRKLALKERAAVLLIYPAALGGIGLGIFLPFFEEVSLPEMVDVPLMVLLGLLSGVGHYFSNKAFALTSVSRLAPFMYLQLLWAAMLGWVFFGEFPSALSFFGFIVISVFGITSAININIWRRK